MNDDEFDLNDTPDAGRPAGHTAAMESLRDRIDSARALNSMDAVPARAAANPPVRPPPADLPLPAAKIELHEDAFRADATQILLNAQLVECVGMVRDAGFLYRNSAVTAHERGCFIDHAVLLMKTSTEVGNTIARLNGGAEPVSITRQHYLVEHVGPAPKGGGGPRIAEND